MPTITNQQNLLNQSAGIAPEIAQSSSPNSQLGQADFLQLLTVQLQNQDPMSPMSDMDFIASMSSFSSVEAMSSLSTNFEQFMSEQGDLNSTTLETLATLSESLKNGNDLQTQLAAQAYLGKQVTIEDPIKGEFTGVVDRVELFDKQNLDGATEQVVGLVINNEIFPVQQVKAVAEEGGLFNTLGNAVSSVAQAANTIF